MELSEQELLRRQALDELIALGIDPYPAASFDVNTTTDFIHNNFESNPDSLKNLSLAGRIMSRRIMGNASFAELQDAAGRIQLYFKRDDICPGPDKSMYNVVFKKLIDIGDILGVKGYAFTRPWAWARLRRMPPTRRSICGVR